MWRQQLAGLSTSGNEETFECDEGAFIDTVTFANGHYIDGFKFNCSNGVGSQWFGNEGGGGVDPVICGGGLSAISTYQHYGTYAGTTEVFCWGSSLEDGAMTPVSAGEYGNHDVEDNYVDDSTKTETQCEDGTYAAGFNIFSSDMGVYGFELLCAVIGSECPHPEGLLFPTPAPTVAPTPVPTPAAALVPSPAPTPPTSAPLAPEAAQSPDPTPDPTTPEPTLEPAPTTPAPTAAMAATPGAPENVDDDSSPYMLETVESLVAILGGIVALCLGIASAYFKWIKPKRAASAGAAPGGEGVAAPSNEQSGLLPQEAPPPYQTLTV